MRLNYYQFPEGVTDNTRAQNGAEALENTCEIDVERWTALDNPHIGCPAKDGDYGCVGCSHLKCVKAGETVDGISVTRAKELLRTFGGEAWTCHIDRDGDCFEVTPILLNMGRSGGI
jgi:hypothetical protein